MEKIWVKDQLQWSWNTGLPMTMKDFFNMVLIVLEGQLYDGDLYEQNNKTARHWVSRAMDKVNFSHRHESIVK